MAAHFPPGSVPLRAPHDLPSHYIPHPSHVVYQQYLRQYIPRYVAANEFRKQHVALLGNFRSPIISGTLEKSSDGQEGEEAPVTSPPLELRRPGSVGLALSVRSPNVAHNLQTSHERTTGKNILLVCSLDNVHTG